MPIEQGLPLSALPNTPIIPSRIYGIGDNASYQFTPKQVADAGHPFATVADTAVGTALDLVINPFVLRQAISAQVAQEFAPIVEQIGLAAEAATEAAQQAEEAAEVAGSLLPLDSYSAALAAAPAVPEDVRTISAVIAGREIRWVRQSGGPMLGGGWTSDTARASLLHLGISGSGADEKAALDAAIATGTPLEGVGLVVSVSGQVDIPANANIEDLTLRQLTPGSSLTMRTLNVVNRAGVRLVRVRVNRNGNGTNGGRLEAAGVNGALNSAFGIFIDNCTGGHFEDLEVWGDDSGTGILFRRLNDTNTVIRPYAHDMRWVRSTGTDDMVQGVWFDQCGALMVVQARADRLTGTLAGAASRRFTRGIVTGGCAGTTFDRPSSVTTDQGIDITGSNIPNSDLRVLSPYVKDAWVWGVKLANSARRCKVIDGLAEDCGVGFTAQGNGALPLAQSTDDSGFYNCTSLNSGSNGQTVVGVAGFRILGGTEAASARNIVLESCLAIDTQSTKTMRHGFHSEVLLASGAPVMVNCRSLGHLTAAVNDAANWRSVNGVGTVSEFRATGRLGARFQIGGNNTLGWCEIREDGFADVHVRIDISAPAMTTANGSLFSTASSVFFRFPMDFISGERPVATATFERGADSLASGVSIRDISELSIQMFPWAAVQIPATASKYIHLHVKGRVW